MQVNDNIEAIKGVCYSSSRQVLYQEKRKKKMLASIKHEEKLYQLAIFPSFHLVNWLLT